jgi:uncharacterized protein YukE
MVQMPSNYDDGGLLIRVDPDSVFRYATVDIMNEAKVMANAISTISQTWTNLQLGWVGTSAQEAQDFNNQWNQAIDRLFGTVKDPASGALPKIAEAVATAAVNYAEAEDAVTKTFRGFTDNQNPQSAPPPGRNQNQGPVTENAPAPP